MSDVAYRRLFKVLGEPPQGTTEYAARATGKAVAWTTSEARVLLTITMTTRIKNESGSNNTKNQNSKNNTKNDDKCKSSSNATKIQQQQQR